MGPLSPLDMPPILKVPSGLLKNNGVLAMLIMAGAVTRPPSLQGSQDQRQEESGTRPPGEHRSAGTRAHEVTLSGNHTAEGLWRTNMPQRQMEL